MSENMLAEQLRMGLDALNEIAPQVAKAHKALFDEYLKQGFTRDEAIQLIKGNQK